jgi:hypothetical protein
LMFLKITIYRFFWGMGRRFGAVIFDARFKNDFKTRILWKMKWISQYPVEIKKEFLKMKWILRFRDEIKKGNFWKMRWIHEIRSPMKGEPLGAGCGCCAASPAFVPRQKKGRVQEPLFEAWNSW